MVACHTVTNNDCIAVLFFYAKMNSTFLVLCCFAATVYVTT